MDRRSIVVSLILGLLTNALWLFISDLVEVPFYIELTGLFILLLATFILAVNYHEMRQFGIVGVLKPSSHKFSFSTQLKSSRKSLYFMGFSARTIADPQIERLIVQKVLSDPSYLIKILVFDRSLAQMVERRAVEETGDPRTAHEWRDIMLSTVQMTLRIKAALGVRGNQLQMREYSFFSVHRMMIIDEKTVYLNHYAKNHYPSEMPYVELSISDDGSSLGGGLLKFFNESWDAARDISIP